MLLLRERQGEAGKWWQFQKPQVLGVRVCKDRSSAAFACLLNWFHEEGLLSWGPRGSVNLSVCISDTLGYCNQTSEKCKAGRGSFGSQPWAPFIMVWKSRQSECEASSVREKRETNDGAQLNFLSLFSLRSKPMGWCRLHTVGIHSPSQPFLQRHTLFPW